MCVSGRGVWRTDHAFFHRYPKHNKKSWPMIIHKKDQKCRETKITAKRNKNFDLKYNTAHVFLKTEPRINSLITHRHAKQKKRDFSKSFMKRGKQTCNANYSAKQKETAGV